MTHPFDVALALDSRDGSARGRTTADFANMVGPFGGVTAAAFVKAIQEHPEHLGDPVSLTVNYAAPITDGAFVIDLRPVRTNRTNQHWTAELIQDGEIKTTATAVFGLRRDTWADTEVSPPAVAYPEDAQPQDISSFVTWTKNYEMRFVEGAMPSSETPDGAEESDNSTTTLWVRAQPERTLDFPALTALCDVFYPRVFLRRGQFIPAGTISFTVYFHADADTLNAQGSDWLLATARAQRFTGGFFDQTAQIWGRDGTLLAVTHQLVYFKS